MIADGIFMLLVYLGFVQFITIPYVQIFLWLFGGFVLIYTGVESMMRVNKLSLDDYRTKGSLSKSFLTGFIMSITSPLSILFWIGIYGSVLAKTVSTSGTTSLIVYSSMIFLGLTFWDLAVAFLTTGFRRFLNDTSLKIISAISGLSLLGFGAYFAYQGIKALIL